MDPANLPATFFALMALNFVGKVGEVDRKKCLKWLQKLQREDGSFGETLGKDGKIEGGRDMRYCQCAAAIRWILRGDLKSKSQKEVDDINVNGLVGHIRKAEVSWSPRSWG
jgi:geranylgeranyl transferase type-1 subunit beta